MKVVLVVGCHRSATSLVAKGLHDAGCPMGDQLLAANGGNPHGYYEDLDAVLISDHALTVAGGTWDHPPAHDAVLDTAGRHAGLVDAYIDGRSRHGLWGVKDPRLCVTWPVWLPALRARGADVHVTLVWRRPAEIAVSLARRDGTPLDAAEALARTYQDRMRLLLEEVTGGGERSLVSG